MAPAHFLFMTTCLGEMHHKTFGDLKLICLKDSRSNTAVFSDSAQTEYCSTFHFPYVCELVTGVTSQ